MEYTIDTHYLFSPYEAKYLLESNYARNRKLDNEHVNFLARQLVNGDFLPNKNIQIAVLNGTRILVDGQHRMSAIVKTGIPFSMPLQVFTCSTLEEVNALYANCDVNKPRSFSEQMNGNDGERKMGVKLGDIKRTKAAIAYMHNPSSNAGTLRKKYSSKEWMQLCDSWIPDYLTYKKIVADGIVGSRMMSACILAAALITLKYNHQLAVDFWTKVSSDDMVAAGHPAKALNRFITTHRLSASTEGKEKSVGRPVMFGACTKAWNKTLAGAQVKSVPTLGKGRMAMPNKTPYDGTYESVV